MPLSAQDGLPTGRDQIAPVILTGTEVIEVKGEMPTEMFEDFKIDRSERVEAKEVQPMRQPRPLRHGGGKELPEPRGQLHALREARPTQSPPEDGLPVVIPPLLPAPQQVRAVDLILIKDLAAFAAELKKPDMVMIALQIGGRFGKGRLTEQLGQEGKNAPAQDCGLEKVFSRAFPGETVEQIPDTTTGQGEVEVCRDAGMQGQLEAHPLGHPLVLDHDDLRGERIFRRLGKDRPELVKEIFQAIGLIHKHGRLPSFGQKA